MLGCIAGIADALLWMLSLDVIYYYFDAANFPPPFPQDPPFFNRLKLYLESNALYHVPYAVEFNCMVAAQLIVLDRIWAPLRYTYLRLHSTQKSALQSFVIRHSERVVLVTVALGFAIILVARTVVTVIMSQETKEVNAILNHFTAGLEFLSSQITAACSSQGKLLKMWSIGVQVSNYCQIAVLCIVVAAFLVTGALFYRRFRVYEASGQGNLLVDVQRRVSVTTVAVFLALSLRTAFFVIVGVSFDGINQVFACDTLDYDSFNKKFCNANPCDTCYSRTGSVSINIWRWYNPLFRQTPNPNPKTLNPKPKTPNPKTPTPPPAHPFFPYAPLLWRLWHFGAWQSAQKILTGCRKQQLSLCLSLYTDQVMLQRIEFQKLGKQQSKIY